MQKIEVFEAIATEARAMGAIAKAEIRTWKDDAGREYNSPVLEINGSDVTYYVDLRDRLAQPVSVWSKEERKKKYSIKVGGYNTRKMGYGGTFPQKKDGSFSWDKIVDILVLIARHQVRQKTADQQREANELVLRELQKEIPGLMRHSAIQIRASDNPEFPIHVTLGKMGAYSVERVREIHAALAAIGLAHFD